MSVTFDGVTVGWQSKTLLSKVSFEARTGEITAIAGRNGVGKSTLLGVLSGAKPDYCGKISVCGRDLRKLTPSQRAQLVAVLGQSLPHPHVTVRELAEFGRTPYLSFGGRLSVTDRVSVERALELAGMSGLAERFVDTLSGGEHRRAFFAMVLAQDAPVLVLDEPTTHLDAAARFEFIDLIRRCKEDGRTVLTVLHELPEMLSCADRIAIISGGGIPFCGSPEEFLRDGMDRRYFDVEVRGNRCSGYTVLRCK